MKLVNEDAKRFQNFMKNFETTAGSNFYNATLKDIHNSNFLISVGSFLKTDAPSVKYAFNNAITLNKGAGLYFHPLGDTHVEGFGKKKVKTLKPLLTNPCVKKQFYFLS